MNLDTEYTTMQISASRRRDVERLRLNLSIQHDEVVMLRDALDVAIAAGLIALGVLDQDNATVLLALQPGANKA